MPAARSLPALAAVICLAGCAGAGPVAQVDDPIPACAAYVADADVYAFCVRREAARVVDEAGARALCATLDPAGDRACRAAWVEERLRLPSAPPREVVMGMCADVPDCAFSTMEALPVGSAVDKIGECERYTGPYVTDCVGHVLQRWVMAGPPDEEIDAVFAAAAAYPVQLGSFAALLRSCQGRKVEGPLIPAEAERVGCPAEPQAQKACLDLMANYARTPPQCSYPQDGAPGSGPPGPRPPDMAPPPAPPAAPANPTPAPYSAPRPFTAPTPPAQ